MSSSIVDQLNAEWEARRLELDSPAKGDRKSLKELHELLAQCTAAGKQVAERVERFQLQGLAREIGDTIFRVTSEYPDTVISPAKLSSALMSLNSLTELMQAHPLREAWAEFRNQCQFMRQQMDLLSDYKALHGLLHELQIRCYKPLVRETRQLSAGAGWEFVELEQYAFDLGMIVDQLRDITSQASFQKNEASWLEYLERAREGLAEARSHGPERLQQAVWQIGRVVTIQPPLINARLNMVYQAMNVPDFLRAMTRLRDQLAPAPADPRNQHELSKAINIMTGLFKRLTVLVGEHVQWQAMDVELRRIEQDPTELEFSWPHVRSMAERLYVSGTDAQALSWREAVAALDSSIASGNVPNLRHTFSRFDRQASQRFYEVDRSLMTLCDSLRAVGEDLALMLQTGL